MIKAVIFDFFGVICSDEYWKFVKEEEDFQGKFHKIADSVNRGELSWEDFLQKVAKETGKDVGEVRQMYASERINVPLVAYIDYLHQKYKTALLTNASASFIEQLIKKADLNKVFDELIISSNIGIVKPDPRIYEYAVKKLGVLPGEAVFIDDSQPRADGARRTGMHVILYQNFPQMKEELEKLLTAGPHSDN